MPSLERDPFRYLRRRATGSAVCLTGGPGAAAPVAGQFTIASQTGLNGYSVPYTSATGYFVVQIVGRNNAASLPSVTVSWGAAPLVVAGETASAVVGSGFATFAGYAVGTPGTANLTFTSGSAGQCLILVTELAVMAADWFAGTVIGAQANDDAIGVLYGSAIGDPGVVFQQAGWITDTTITQTETSEELWQSKAGTTTTAAFYQVDNGLAPAGFDWTTPNIAQAVCLVVEVQGAVLP